MARNDIHRTQVHEAAHLSARVRVDMLDMVDNFLTDDLKSRHSRETTRKVLKKFLTMGSALPFFA